MCFPRLFVRARECQQGLPAYLAGLLLLWKEIGGQLENCMLPYFASPQVGR